MNYIDFIIIAITAVGFILGFKDGLIRKIIGLAGLILGVVFALQFSSALGEILAPILNDDRHLANIASGLLIFLGTIVIASIIKRLVHPSDKVNKMLNQLLGGLAGALQIIFFISGFFLFLNVFNVPAESTRNQSLLYEPVYNIVPSTIDFFIGSQSEASNFIKNFIEDRDQLEIPIDTDSTNFLEEFDDNQ